MGFYDDMALMAKELLAELNQGTVEIGRAVVTTGVNSWDAPSVSVDYVEINSVVRGVSRKFVDGVTVMDTDLQVISSIEDYEPLPGDLMRIDGKPVVLIKQEKIPGAGIVAAWRFIVRA
jgi:hypothetical protein